MRITVKGQVTIPLAMRRRYQLEPYTEVEFTPTEEGVLIKPASSRRERLLKGLKRAAGSSTSVLTTDAIMQMTRGED